ncbi:MAG: hypothetical protein R2758_04510 [Bacteroidales bacterium]
MRTLIVIVFIISSLTACKSYVDTEGKILSHRPTEEVNVVISNTSIKVDFSLDEIMRRVITSETGQHKIDSIKTLEELAGYYVTLSLISNQGIPA